MASNEFGNDLMKMCFEHKNNNEGSLSRYYFCINLSHKLWLLMVHF